jgi:uncharacterized protein (TIGR03067 family)
MKKIVMLILVAILGFGMIGCTGSESKKSEGATTVATPSNAESTDPQIEGKWEIVHAEFSGRSDSSVLGVVNEIVDNKWIRPNRRTSVYVLKLNPNSNPKQMDLSANRLGNNSLKGIYKVEGDKLFFCYAYDPNLNRPENFKTESGEDRYLYVLKKVD